MSDLKTARIVVTIPPKGWFGGYDRISAFALVEQLERRFGCEFYQLDTTPFAEGNAFKRNKSVEALRAYKPDLAISLNNAGYGLLCSVPTEQGNANLFTDVLAIPLMLPWDHGLFQFPSLVPPRHPDTVARDGSVIPSIRRVLDNPLIHHLPIDSGQVAEMQRIGMLGSSNIGLAPAAAYRPYLEHGRRNLRARETEGLTFVGNLYAGAFSARATASTVERQCQDQVIAAKQARPLANSWQLLREALAGVDPAERTRQHLEFADARFWQFADDLIRKDCNMIGRTRTLEAVAHRVGLYGEFAPGASIEGLKRFGNIDYNGYVDFAEGLPSVYAGAAITLDVTNAAFIANCSSKPICCLAAGGFPLFDFKQDAIETLGSEASAMMYRSAEELNGKIEHYLSHPAEKRDLAREMQARVRQRCDFANVLYDRAEQILGVPAPAGLWSRLSGLLSAKPVVAETQPTAKPAKVVDPPDAPGAGTAVAVAYDVQRDLYIQDDWGGARIVGREPLVLETAGQPWSFSAYLAIGAAGAQAVGGPGRYWVAVRGRCAKGSFAVSLKYGDDLVGETVVRASPAGFETFLMIEFPDALEGMMIRNELDASALVQLDSIALLREPV